jgi:alpha-N-arabinofuranosidase
LVAATNFHIFHRNAGRVHMANIAQMVNVLQAMILTDGPRMALTPTYHAFDLYKPFQGATALGVTTTTPEYALAGDAVPAVDITAARDAAGAIQLGIVNVDPHRWADVTLTLPSLDLTRVEGQMLTAHLMDSTNRFGGVPGVVPANFRDFRLRNGKLVIRAPAKSIVRLTLNGKRRG